MAFYDIYEHLCKEKGVSPTKAARENGIQQGTISMWKKRGSTPNAITLVKLADYFNTTPAYLAGNDMAKEPLTLERDQAMKDHVARRFEEAEDWKALSKVEKIAGIVEQLNDGGQDKVLDYAVDVFNNPENRKP